MSIDPTAIDIRFDPTRQRMSGTAVHGLKRFDVPYISHIDGNLWTGGCTTSLILPTEIEHVVSLYPWETYQVRHELRSNTSVRMYDSRGGVDVAQLLAVGAWVNECCRTGPTLVHCQAGLNRSGMVAATALVLGGVEPSTAIDLLRSKRSDAVLCNPDFEHFVRDLPRVLIDRAA